MDVYRESLKIQALLERINENENRIADLRVDLTISEQERISLQDAVTELKELNQPVQVVNVEDRGPSKNVED